MEEPKTYHIQNCTMWGNTIYFLDFKSRTITGHMSEPNLREGDFLTSDMSSGKVVKFIITEIEYYSVPNDQFFGTVIEYDRYLERINNTLFKRIGRFIRLMLGGQNETKTTKQKMDS